MMDNSPEKLLEKQTARYDAIRTENIRKERRYAKEWGRNWGFLAQAEDQDTIVEKFCDAAVYYASAVGGHTSLKELYELYEKLLIAAAVMKAEFVYDPEKYDYHPAQWVKRVRDVAPKEKYLCQQAASHQIGWITESLEKFGVHQYGCRHASDIQAARRKTDEKSSSKS